MKTKRKILISWIIVLVIAIQTVMPAIADSIETEWRAVSSYPQISFRDEEGNIIEGLESLSENDAALEYTTSQVKYKNDYKISYSSVDLAFSYVDYSSQIYTEYMLPEIESVVAEMEFAGKNYSAGEISCSVSDKGYLRIDAVFEKITPFNDMNTEAEIYLQYRPKVQLQNSDGDFYYDESSDIAKGSVVYSFKSLKTVDLTVEKEDDEQIKVEVVLPSDNKEETVRSTTPYVLIDACTIGDGQKAVYAGNSFDLTIDCGNSHNKMDLDNVLMQVEVPKEFCLDHASNTFHIGNVKEGGSFQRKLRLIVDEAAAAQNYEIKIKFSYEYVDGSRRYEDLTSIVQIPVKQGFSFIVDPLSTRNDYYTIRDHEIYSSFANVGRSKVYNVTAQLVAEELESEQKILRLGSVDAGVGSKAVFTVCSRNPGTYPIEIIYRYEDIHGQQYSEKIESELKFVDLPQVVVEETEKEPIIQYVSTLPTQQPQNNSLGYIIVGVTAVAMVFLALVLIIETRRKNR